jgi:predicted nucleic acid-binding protein
MNRKIYVETSVISYLTAKATHPAAAYRQQQAQRLWESKHFIPVISEVVLDEISRGDANQARLRLELVANVALLPVTEEASYLAQLLIDRKALPTKAFSDALHIAVTTVHHIPAIASYNFRHIAGAFSRRLIEQTLQQLGYVSPVIASPEDIVGGVP